MPEHPYLPAGYNADDWDGDEIDGAGTNWAIWPVLFDAYIGYAPLIITDDMMAVFDEACPDFSPAGINTTLTLPAVNREITISANGWTTITFAYENNVVMIKRTSRSQVIAADWGDEALPMQDNRILLKGGTDVVKPRKRS